VKDLSKKVFVFSKLNIELLRIRLWMMEEMIDKICLDEKYSTTRLVTKEKPEIANNPDGKFKTLLFLPEYEGRNGEGGLRKKGYFKKSYKNKPLITVITVVFNGEKYLEETIQSIINQTYDNVEYIIIDGGSTDGTLDIIKKYENKIDYWISEKDKGIYDAMNKGIDVATGDWINFMNAGDGFYDIDVLNKIFSQNDLKKIDILYGNHNVIYPHKTRIAKAGNMKNIWKGSQFSHQSTFVSSIVHKANKYNFYNKIAADFELFYTLYKKKINFKYVDIIVVNYSAGGFSDTNRVACRVSFWNVVEKSTKVNFYYIWTILKEIFKGWVKKFVGK